jgi:hypothetical protein
MQFLLKKNREYAILLGGGPLPMARPTHKPVGCALSTALRVMSSEFNPFLLTRCVFTIPNFFGTKFIIQTKKQKETNQS